MTRIHTFLLLVVFSAIAFPAHADTISTFNVAGDHAFSRDPARSVGPPVSGTITIDTTTGQVLSVNLVSYPDLISLEWETFSDQYVTEIIQNFSSSVGHNDGFTSITLDLPVTSLIGYSGGFLCSTAHDCNGRNGDYVRGPEAQTFTDGAVTPVPEPSSIFLVATGLLCAAKARPRAARSVGA